MPSDAYTKLQWQAQDLLQAWRSASYPRILVGISECGISVGAHETLAAVREELAKLRIPAQVIEVGDMGFCWAEPVIDIVLPGQNRITYGKVTADKVPALLHDVLVDGNLRPDMALGVYGDEALPDIPRLMDQPWMRHQTRLLMRNFGMVEPGNLQHYVARGGYAALDKALMLMLPNQVIEEVKRSGLRGRGGALFLTGVKWSFLLNAPPGERYLAVNGEEGDPGAFTDKAIAENDPHTLLEGILIAAYAMGCTKTFIHIRAEYALAVERLRRALREAQEAKFAGHRIMGTNFSHEIEIEATGHAYICGEETALMESVEGKRGAPRPRPPFPAQYGIFGKPTNVNNVKTIAFAPTVIGMGGTEFAKIGTQNASGTAMLSLSGHINRRGIAEVPVGLPLRTVIEEVAGGVRNGKRAKAFQTGGPLGGLMAAAEMDMPTEFQAMSAKGAPLGSGGIMVLDEDTCIVDMAKNVAEFNEEESCGKCFPCRKGTGHVVRVLNEIVSGFGNEGDMEKIREVGKTMVAGSLCGLGQLAPNVLNSAFRYFGEEFMEHARDKRCRTGTCAALASMREAQGASPLPAAASL